jgi:hypothetical protein
VNYTRNERSLFKVAVVFSILSTLLSLGVAGGIVYVAIHFITKVW